MCAAAAPARRAATPSSATPRLPERTAAPNAERLPLSCADSYCELGTDCYDCDNRSVAAAGVNAAAVVVPLLAVAALTGVGFLCRRRRRPAGYRQPPRRQPRALSDGTARQRASCRARHPRSVSSCAPQARRRQLRPQLAAVAFRWSGCSGR